MKNLSEYHDLYLTNDTLLLAHVFENFRKMCIAWKTTFKKTKVELELLTDIDILLMAKEKGIRGEVCCAIHRYPKPKNKYKNNYDKIRNFHI